MSSSSHNPVLDGPVFKGAMTRDATATTSKPNEGAESSTTTSRGLFCARCSHLVTREEQRVEVGGCHEHIRVNPAGVVFRFGCYGRADGCSVGGLPTTDHVWFAGFAWQYALCGSCSAHLGWFFSGGPSFFGLVLDRLVRAA